MNSRQMAEALGHVARAVDWSECAVDGSAELEPVWTQNLEGVWTEHRANVVGGAEVALCGLPIDDMELDPRDASGERVECFACRQQPQIAVPALMEVQSFEDRGLGRYNDGLVLTFADGSEYQVTVVKSQSGR